MLYDVYQLCVGGERAPNEVVLARGKVRGILNWKKRYEHPGYWAELVDDKGRDLIACLSPAKRFDHPDGRVKIVGVQMHGSQSPKSKRWWNERQVWLCKPVAINEKKPASP